MDNLRLFVGIDLPERMIERLSAAFARMETALPFRKWTHPADLHVTLHFLGDTRADRLDAVRAALAQAAAATAPMQLTLTAPGTFGPPNAPRILWLGLEGDVGSLRHLHAALAPGLSAAGFALDARPFRPHLTLARHGGAGCGEAAIHAAWREAVAASAGENGESGESEPFAWTADRLTLFRSHLGRRPSYERLNERRFSP